jgi:hypothetical protein
MVRSVPLEGARIFSYTGSDYGWLTRDASKLDYRITAKRGEEEIPFRLIHIEDENGPFTGGVVDRAMYSRIEISFELPNIDVLKDKASSEALKAWVETAARNFTDWYRVATNESDVARVRMADAPIVDIWTADDYTFSAAESSGRFVRYARRLNWAPPEAGELFKQSTAASVISNIDGLLKRGDGVPLYLRLLLDAKEQAHLRQEYDLSIVVSQTALEAFLQQRLHSLCTQRSIVELPRRTGSKTDAFAEAIERGNVKADLLRWAKQLSGADIQGSTEYAAWESGAYTPRNAVVHRGQRGATAADAKVAFESVMNLIALLERVVV